MSSVQTNPSQDETGRVVPMRLQRYLARSGVASRRGAEGLMTAGRVRVNGEVVRELGSKVDPACDVVSVDGKVVRPLERPAYLVLNKPAGYLTTMSDPHGRRTVAALVPTERFPGLFPVGRLDQDTTGILLFTTNGDAAHELLHPSRHVYKHYLALVEGTPSAEELARLRAGVMLDDGPTQPAEVDLLEPGDEGFSLLAEGFSAGERAILGIRIAEGRKHQVKRMCAAVGHAVVRLHRDAFGPLRLRGCASGSWRMLDEREVEAVEKLVARGRESRATTSLDTGRRGRGPRNRKAAR